MADIRINALATTAASTASDDFVAVDGSANGTRKLSAYSPTFGGNLTVSGTGTSSVAGVFKAGTDIVTGDTSAFQVHNNVDDKPMVGFYRGGTLRSVLRLNTDNDFRLLSSNLSTPANLTVGNLTTSGVSYNDFAGALWLGTTAGYGTLNVGNVSGTGTATYSCLTIGDQSTPANATGIYMRGTSAVCGISTAGAPIAFFTGGPGTSEAARFFNNGNFGIGTTTDAGGKLQIATGANNTLLIGNDATYTSYNQISLNGTRTNSDVLGIIGGGTGDSKLYLLAPTGGGLLFQIAGSTVFSVNSSGDATFAGTIAIGQYTTAGAPAYAKGKLYFDVTLNKLRVGGATGWETITSV